MGKHEIIKKRLKLFGLILVTIGSILTIIGFVDFIVSFANFDAPKLFWCLFIGLPTFGVGMMSLLSGYHKEIRRYVKNETVPIINETSEEVAPAVSNIARAVNSGLNSRNSLRCSCGEINEEGNNFCTKCGKPLYVVCPNCGEESRNDNSFCGKCGTKL